MKVLTIEWRHLDVDGELVNDALTRGRPLIEK